MNNTDSNNVKSCWTKIKKISGSDKFAESFYQILFKQHPETRSLFPDELQKQKSILLETLDNVINGYAYLNELEDELIDLGRRHKDLGVAPPMYDIFLETIVAAANISSKFTLTDSELDDWEQAFKAVSNIMLKGY